MAAKRKPKSSKETGLLQIPNQAWTLTRPEPAAGRRSTRAGGAGEATPVDPLPDFLPKEDFEVLDQGELRSTPGRRSAEEAPSSNVQIKTELAQDASVLMVARQESGALSFHFPTRAVGRRAAGGSAKATLTFDIPVLEGEPGTGRRGLISKFVRVVLVKVAKAVVGKLVDLAAEWAVPKLARALEEHLWKDRTQGWLRVTPEGLAAKDDRLGSGKPAFRSPERGLLFIHGTFSTAYGGFKGLAGTNFFTEARKLYGGNFFGFNHFTISKTPEQNVQELLDALPDQDFEFDIITHSRGGLVVRELLERSGLRHPKRARLKIGKVIMVASPSMGTPLGSPSHWDDKLSFLANLLELLPDNPFSTAGAWISEALKWIAGNVLGNCAGLVAMDPGSDYIHELQSPPDAPAGTLYHALVSNFQPPREWWARLADMGVDTFFEGANDLVVPTEGGWKTSDAPAAWMPAERVACFGPGGNLRTDLTVSVNHVQFFNQPDSAAFMLSCLRGEPTALSAIDLARALPSRDVRGTRGGSSTAGRAAVVRASSEESVGEKAKVEVTVRSEPLSALLTSGWDVEEELWLSVVSHTLRSRVEEESEAAGPILMAQYGSARVAVPFLIRGQLEDAGKRWHKLIAYQNQLVDYANGADVAFQTSNGEVDAPDQAFLEDFGNELFNTLFPGEVRNLYNVARFLHKKRRLKIIFSSMIPWVADFPWELAYDRSAKCFLTCADVRFVRNVLTPTPANKIVEKKDRALRILVVSAQPSGLGGLSIEEESRGIRESFRPLIDAGLVEVEVLASAMPSLLQERLRCVADGDDFDVLHFIGHGEFDENTKTGYLIFQDETGRAKRLSAANFLNIVRGRDIRVIFLNACETGRGGKADYNRGVAMALAQDGIPAVVANQYSVIDRSASLFSLHFYACLAQGLKIADAMREARIALQYCGVEPMDWAVPVLFASNPDARLCTRAPRPASSGNDPMAAFSVLSRRSSVSHSGSSTRKKTIAVWDTGNSLIYRENLQGTLDELNEAQRCFAFQLERFSAPRTLWAADNDPSSDGIAYLRAEKLMGRTERIRQSIGTDYLFCVTDLPFRDKHTIALYYYHVKKISILSTWGLETSLEGKSLKKAIANHLAITLIEDLSGATGGETVGNDPGHPIHTTGYFNDERSVAHITGPMTINADTLKKIKSAIKAKQLSTEEFEAIKKLLLIYT